MCSKESLAHSKYSTLWPLPLLVKELGLGIAQAKYNSDIFCEKNDWKILRSFKTRVCLDFSILSILSEDVHTTPFWPDPCFPVRQIGRRSNLLEWDWASLPMEMVNRLLSKNVWSKWPGSVGGQGYVSSPSDFCDSGGHRQPPSELIYLL